jgi:hypothetical protein
VGVHVGAQRRGLWTEFHGRRKGYHRIFPLRYAWIASVSLFGDARFGITLHHAGGDHPVEV